MDNYGITEEDYKEMYRFRGGLCDICQRKYDVLNIDHRHILKFKKLPPEKKKLEVRGLACFRCNKFTLAGIEIHKNSRDILDRINMYFEQHKMKGDE